MHSVNPGDLTAKQLMDSGRWLRRTAVLALGAAFFAGLAMAQTQRTGEGGQASETSQSSPTPALANPPADQPPSQPTATPSPAATSAAPASHHRRQKKAAAADPAPDPTPAPPPAPVSLLQQPATPATVTANHETLTVNANNSSLTQILHQVASATGMQLDGLGGDERVFGRFGPATPRAVLTALLNGTSYNVMMVGDLPNGAPRQLLLTHKVSGGAAAPNAAAPSGEQQDMGDDSVSSDDADDNGPAPLPPAPPQSPQPGIRTPQQVIQQMQQMRNMQNGPTGGPPQQQ